MSDAPKSSDQLPEEGPAAQVPDDVPHAREGAAREAGRAHARQQAAAVSDRRRGLDGDSSFEREEVEQAAAEAAQIGGRAGDEQLDPAERPVIEGGGGEAEGFEEAESALIEHASHADQQSAHSILHHQGLPEEDDPLRENGEADHEHSSERPEDERG